MADPSDRMNLRDQLKNILPEILPRNPSLAIKGTDLIELVKFRLKQAYSDATLRYHFSIMSCDPSSPIAKVEQGQGYYLRSTTIHSLNSARNLINPSLFGEPLSSDESELRLSRANKFRATVQRYLLASHRYPFVFEKSFDASVDERRWSIPDLAAVEWLAGSVDEAGFRLDPGQIAIRRMLGSAPLRLTSVKLKLELNHASLRQDLYQSLAISEWCNGGELMIAARIDEEHLNEEIRQFGARHGIGVTVFGLDADMLDDMPEPAVIANLLPREFDAIQSLFKLRRLTSPRLKSDFDWQTICDQRVENPDFALLGDWIAHCLESQTAMTLLEFQDQALPDADSPQS
ncbi:MAG: hypothetical protein H7A54_17665 [Akkermansiaceae bacterium]|nr:hypothetical protein [Akkermansiaceae bacterium]